MAQSDVYTTPAAVVLDAVKHFAYLAYCLGTGQVVRRMWALATTIDSGAMKVLSSYIIYLTQNTDCEDSTAPGVQEVLAELHPAL